MPNYRRHYISNVPVFVTVVTKNRSPWLIENVDQLLGSMREAKNKYPYRHVAHVVMADHLIAREDLHFWLVLKSC